MAISVKRPYLTHNQGVSFLFKCFVAISLLISLTIPGLTSAGSKEDSKTETQLPNTARTHQAPALDVTRWGLVTAPVYGTSNKGAYRRAELFPGPKKFGSYFAGVLPNGRVVKPAGISTQVGMNPLGAVVTLDGKYLITSNNDENDAGFESYQNPKNLGAYSLSVIDTGSMQVVSNFSAIAEPGSANAAPGSSFYIGLQVTGTGPYTLWASGGADNDIKVFDIDAAGIISGTPATRVPITPITPGNQGFVSNYTPAPTFFSSSSFTGFPWGFNASAGAQATWPAGSALSRDGKFLYVACNADNSIAVIDTIRKQVVKQVAVGYFPYGVSLSGDGQTVTVSNWGITEYKFKQAMYDNSVVPPKLTALAPVPNNQTDGFYVPVTSTSGVHPKTSSISILNAPGADGSKLSLVKSVYQGHAIDALNTVGDTHPSATAILDNGKVQLLYVTKTNSDRLGVINLANNESLDDIDLSPLKVGGVKGNALVGAYPNAIVISPDNTRMYVAEAGINSVAVLDITNPFQPKLLGRMPTGWYPTALALSGDGRYLYVVNAKGVGEDINPNINTKFSPSPPTGLASDPNTDSHCIFGTVQKVDLTSIHLQAFNVLANNYSMQKHADSRVVPIGGPPSGKIKHVFYILQENKTFDSMLGNLGSHLSPYASVIFNYRDGSKYTNQQFTGVAVNMQLLARKFATAVNYYSDSEESFAGHNFCTSGTATDYTEKTLLMSNGRGCLMDGYNPEEYPENGYIFNNAARNGVDLKVFGDPTLLDGTDTGSFTKSTTIDDPTSGSLGYPLLTIPNISVTDPLENGGDVESITQGLGQSYFLQLPMLAILGENNVSGEPRIDTNYPGFNLNISDQRRAEEFIRDFDRMVSQGTLPHYMHIWLPNSHTGYGAPLQAPNASKVVTNSPMQQVADSDVALGMIVNHIMNSPVYFNQATGEGSAIFITFDDAQATLDHIHPHRTPLIVVSPYARPGYVAKRHYSSASVVKTEELLLGLPPNNLGDLFATDLRDLFQSRYNKIHANDVPVTKIASYTPSEEGQRIWSLAKRLDLSGVDRDSFRLGALARLSIGADDLHRTAKNKRRLNSRSYKAKQARLFRDALQLVSSSARHNDND
jgi:YVTN family beta-propeller protein